MDEDYYEDDDEKAPRRGREIDSEARTWAMLAHLSYLVLAVIGPLIIMIAMKEKGRFVETHAKEALNFQITVMIAAFACIPLMFVIVGIFLLPVIAFGAVIYSILAGLAANEGRRYRYPMTIRMVT